MKTITKIKQLALTAITLLCVSFMAKAQTTMYSTNWNDGFDNWTVESVHQNTIAWDHRGSSDGIQAGNSLDMQSEEWIVSPEFDFSDGSTFTIIFDRAQSDNASPAGKLDIIYTTNWSGSVASAAWQTLDLDITNGLTVGWNGGDGYVTYTKAIASTSATTRFAFKYTSDGYDDNGTPDNTEDDINRNRVRVKDFSITTSGSVSAWPLPYTAAWTDDLEDWTVVSHKHASKEWTYKSGGTAFMTDGKQDQDDWLISPTIVCSGSLQKEISFKAGWKSFQSSNISLYYSLDYAGVQEDATWIPITEELIPTTHGFGFATDLLYNYSHVMDLDQAAVTFGIHYAPFGAYGDSQNETRIKNFKVKEYVATSLDDQTITGFKVFPNPATDILNVTNVDNATAEIYNLAGQLLKKVVVSNQQINVANLPVGQYIIMVQQDDKVAVTKFVKK
ncbi:T9SS type A sorting domain-containing protein [Carboxylicivirga sp. M1479]|uniref:T9SS type A sorting domain-containing protein n=1 Tax=Carboxylicivirga sp. M1479 TaxID=2594476 RepID=UPI0011780238|nr:T9SS type A sorting domain-containing protein [Carboxylicivirga sp. M1479]TRX66419.1 T9SS type A sorting domain-containing protein [Carboxylicivirga sp. M1479]